MPVTLTLTIDGELNIPKWIQHQDRKLTFKPTLGKEIGEHMIMLTYTDGIIKYPKKAVFVVKVYNATKVS